MRYDDENKEYLEDIKGDEYGLISDFITYNIKPEYLWADDYIAELTTDRNKEIKRQEKLLTKAKLAENTRKENRKKLLEQIKNKLTAEEIKVFNRKLSSEEKKIIGLLK